MVLWNREKLATKKITKEKKKKNEAKPDVGEWDWVYELQSVDILDTTSDQLWLYARDDALFSGFNQNAL